MINKSAVLGLFSKNDENIDKALDMIILEHKNRILEKIYYEQEELEQPSRNFCIISREDYKEIMELYEKYKKFEDSQRGRKRIEVNLNEIFDLKDIGLSNRQIADKLNVSEGTIRSRLKREKTSINMKELLINGRK